MNRYYAEFMTDYLGVSRERVHIVPHGLNLDGHGTGVRLRKGETPTIGYLARICPEKGLHLLVEAFEMLTQDAQLPPLRLRVAGYLGNLDKSYFESVVNRVKSWRRPERFEYVGVAKRIQRPHRVPRK
jgi:glycosyltransferase involved in cell wall biosynthesis